MMSQESCGTITVDSDLFRFINDEALPGTGIAQAAFWDGAARIFAQFAPRNRDLLERRDALQASIDNWHIAHREKAFDPDGYAAFLREIGYIVPEPSSFTISTTKVDPEVAICAGPQLVVPVTNDRFAVNAANARWGSLYDALYGTDALPGAASTGGYDAVRGAQVIGRAKAFLDSSFPLTAGTWAQVSQIELVPEGQGRLAPQLTLTDGTIASLADAAAFAGYRGNSEFPAGIVLRRNGLHAELQIDRDHPVGRTDPAGICDVILESALTTIIDLEDSVAVVDGPDKVAAYRNWLGLMRGDIAARFEKGGREMVRTLNPDIVYHDPSGAQRTLKGRSLLFVRNVGHLMTTPAVLLGNGMEAPEGILDALVTSLIALHDLRRDGGLRNSACGSIYIVKPKMHGPEEAALTNDLFDAVEDLLGLERHTIKVGVMDEERRTSANLAACIHAVRGRIAFINTGFLDRTGDEMHTSMQAGAMVPKAEMKSSKWIRAYEDRNVRIGLACGFAGRAQIGKGMWAAPDLMGAMLAEKGAHPRAGASTAWVPSPTAATLHAMHYHEVNVREVQERLSGEPVPPLADLLEIPLAMGRNWTEDEIARELENNAQGILGYVVRWIDQGIGCSKVPDINDIGLMEDRATLRISSQHLANWLLHGVCSIEAVDQALVRMAAKVDEQNAADPAYSPMLPDLQSSLAFKAGRSLVMDGMSQPSGYTEPLLHAFRLQKKQA